MSDLELITVHDENNNNHKNGNVLFLHGLCGDKTLTWSSGNNNKKVFWPEMLYIDNNDINFYSLGYNCNTTKWSKYSKYNQLSRISANILDYLIGIGLDDLPTIIIAHSYGGLIVKQMAYISGMSGNRRYANFNQSLKGVSFIATPHSGSIWANYLSNISKIFPPLRSSERIEDLSVDNSIIDDLNRWFRDNILFDQIECQAFYEKETILGQFIVTRDSADPKMKGCIPIGIKADHIEIAKPKSNSDPIYVSVNDLIDFHLRK